MEGTAINLAHRYASAAEGFQERNHLAEAADMHLKAADQFLLATQDTHNQEIIRTLKLMNANHIRQAKDLQRRIAKTAVVSASPKQSGAEVTTEEGIDEYFTHATSLGTTSVSSTSGEDTELPTNPSAGWRHGSPGHHQQQQQQGNSNGIGRRHANAIISKQAAGDIRHESMVAHSGGAKDKSPSGSHGSYRERSTSFSNPSSTAIEESFTLVKEHVKDESDPFNKFWEEVENLILKLSSPVAFTTIPLDVDEPTTLNSPVPEDHTSLTSPLNMPFAAQGADGAEAQQIAMVMNSNNDMKMSSANHCLLAAPSSSKSHVDPIFMQESFYIVDSPSTNHSSIRGHSRNTSVSSVDSNSVSSGGGSDNPPRSSSRKKLGFVTEPVIPSKTLEEYALENQELKLALNKLSRKNYKLEKHFEGAMQMSVWTNDIRKSALQLIKSQDLLRPVKQSIHDLAAADKSGSLLQRAQAAVNSNTTANNITGSQPSTPSASQISTNPLTMQARIQELEAEVQKLQLENSKLNSLMRKYKQRWEDLKESAKKRRNANMSNVQDGAASTVTTTTENNNHSFNHASSKDGRSPIVSQRPLLQSGSSPYSSSSLANNPNPTSINSGSSPSTRPLSLLSRSSSASGTSLSTTASHQKRILMDSRAGAGPGLDLASLNIRRNSAVAGIVSSASPRVLDSSPRTNVGVLAALPDDQTQRPTSTPVRPTWPMLPSSATT
ncbi:hypothetical protein BCR41DRAFT_221422 [Lobosporangium transversale]|uniref:MIT domain-containing protein n=1 Tax=Lobosporangium transversale TaxID=64571 RepID=A0A1Y2GVQ3_9FUNG|nr:hypothetical protein BCR41DRAFT_221422 [Lobosporangium transversale]ORZ26368.1 hypothetical protein BCR41DRAFT_221422 [Lobosporangium transversale]|eukprot:XP_021884133.1 hypothetical protein BCR41DRAFT_221422 [Lobosporangium transversale]